MDEEFEILKQKFVTASEYATMKRVIDNQPLSVEVLIKRQKHDVAEDVARAEQNRKTLQQAMSKYISRQMAKEILGVDNTETHL